MCSAADTNESSVLAAAVYSGNEEMVKYLLERGYKPEQRGYELHIAVAHGTFDILRLLLSSAATGIYNISLICRWLPFDSMD